MHALILLAVLSADSRSTTTIHAPRFRTRTEMMQARREAEKARRGFERWRMPQPKAYTAEEMAKKKWDASEKLLLARCVDAAVRWRQALVKDYPATETAKVAQEWLWANGY